MDSISITASLPEKIQIDNSAGTDVTAGFYCIIAQVNKCL